jgi:hypothetical protein
MELDRLDSEQIEAIRHTIHTGGWAIMVERWQKVRDEATKQLFDPGEERKNNLPDDYLRGLVQAISVVLSLGSNTVKDYDDELARQERERIEAEKNNEPYVDWPTLQ